MPFPDLAKLNKIFDTYITALDSQPMYKRFSIAIVNSGKSWLPQHQDNEYIMDRLDDTKKGKIEGFKAKFSEAAAKKTNWVAAWISIQDELDDNLAKVKIAEAVHESKFALALRAASVIICSSLCEEKEFQDEIDKYVAMLNEVDNGISDTETAGHKPSSVQINQRNSLLIKLANFGEYKFTIKATQLGLLDNFEKPDLSFMPKVSFNPYLSKDAEINTHVPWAYQKILPEVYSFRTTHHKWPSKVEWDKEKTKSTTEIKEVKLENKEAKAAEVKVTISTPAGVGNSTSPDAIRSVKASTPGRSQVENKDPIPERVVVGSLAPTVVAREEKDEGIDEFAIIDDFQPSPSPASLSHTAKVMTSLSNSAGASEKKREVKAAAVEVVEEKPTKSPSKKSKKSREEVEAAAKAEMEKRKQTAETVEEPETPASVSGKRGKKHR